MQRHTPPPSHAHASGLGSTPEAASSKWRRWMMFPSGVGPGSGTLSQATGWEPRAAYALTAIARALLPPGQSPRGWIARAPLGGTATHLVGAATDVGDEHAQPTDVVLHQGRHGDTALALDPLWAFAVQNALLL